MNLNFNGKRALICGSTDGIGKATAILMADLGAEVILLARDQYKLDNTLDELSTKNSQSHSTICADFNNPEKLKEIVNKDIFSTNENGAYYFSGGWHLKAIYSVVIGFIFASSTIWNFNLMFLQSYSWIIGAFIAALVYYLLAKE